MDLSRYVVDPDGAVILSDELQSWVDSGTAWRRYWLYHRICRETYEGRLGGPPPVTLAGRTLADQGVLVLDRLISAEDCATFSQTFTAVLEQKFGGLANLPKTEFTLPWNHFRAGLLRRVLPLILAPERTAAIEDYFGAHFQILGISLNRYLPSAATDVSFLWHRDQEPPQQLHLMVYLTGASEQGGRTEVLDLEATRRAARAGYSYPGTDDRTSDVAALFGGNADGVSIIRPELAPGGGMLFAAPRNLHRGVRPLQGWRDTLLMLLIPSTVPWQERLAANFPNVLRDGPHYNSGYLNPFGKDAPTAENRHGLAPDWARDSYLGPADGALP